MVPFLNNIEYLYPTHYSSFRIDIYWYMKGIQDYVKII